VCCPAGESWPSRDLERAGPASAGSPTSLFVGLPRRLRDGWRSTRRRRHVGRRSDSAVQHDSSGHLLPPPGLSLAKTLLSYATTTWGCCALIHPAVFALGAMIHTLPPFGHGRWRLRPSHRADSHSPTGPLHLTERTAFQPAQPRCRAWASIAEIVAVSGGGFRESRPLVAVSFERNRDGE
jgi:hypothetical protein